MASTNLLHALEFPDAAIRNTDALYVRVDGDAAVGDRSVVLAPQSTVDFDTYFNCFTIGVWNRSAHLDDLALCVDVDGPCTLEIWSTDEDGSSRLATATTAGGSTVVPVPDHHRLSGICWLRVLSGSDPVTVVGGGWRTSTVPRRNVRLAVVMTTFRREAYVERNVALIDRYAAADPDHLRDVRVTIVDNGHSVQLDPADHRFDVEVLPNRNLGGAGGFARGLIAHRTEGWATHVAFADDDIVLRPSLLDRTATFLAHAVDGRRCLAAAMLDEDHPAIQYECGATFSTRQRHPAASLGARLDLTAAESLVANSQETHIDYGGWWFFAFPLDLTDDNPLPVFVRGDDVEFGLSHCRGHIQVMNGVGVWHQNFEHKNNPSTYHLEARNHPLVGVLTDTGYRGRHVVARFAPIALRFLLSLKYSSAEQVLAGLREFSAGPERWLALDHEAEFDRIRREAEEKVAPLDDELRGLPFVEAHGPSLWATLSLSGHLVPRRFSRRPPVAVAIQSRPLAASMGRESVVYLDRPTGEGFVAARDRRRFFRGLADLMGTMLQVGWRFGRVAGRYRARRADLLSDQYWEAQFADESAGLATTEPAK